MANGTPPGLPGWLAPVVTLTTQVGIPSVFAGVLLWFVLTQVGSSLSKIQTAEDERIAKVLEMQATLVGALEQQTRSFEAAIQENIKANREMMDRYHRERDRGLP